jgi:hypothetical protein
MPDDPHVVIRPGPAYVDSRGQDGVCTDVLILWREREYGSRLNYVIADTPENRKIQANAFLSRQKVFVR